MEVDGDMLVERVGAKSLCDFLLLSVKPQGVESQCFLKVEGFLFEDVIILQISSLYFRCISSVK